MAPWTYEQGRAGYRNLWNKATIKAGADDRNADLFADRIIAAEQRYKTVEAKTGVPWFFIGALHMREFSNDFNGVLHNGDKIIGTGRLTTHVPEGRGPFNSWEESAVDALRYKNLHRVQEWTVERMLYESEGYNGWGYAGKGINSPYVWAGTTNEQTGKYIADHVWSSTAEDSQLGIAAVLKRLAERRPDIAAALKTDAPPPPQDLPADKPATGKDVEIYTPGTALPGMDLNQLLPLMLMMMLTRQTGGATPAGQPDMMAALMAQMFGVKLPPPAPVDPPKTPPPLATGTTPAATTPPSVQLSIGALIAGILGMFIPGTGGEALIGTPFGMGQTPTTTGTMSVLLPALSAVAGNFGIWGQVAKLGFGLLGRFAPSPK